VVRGEGDNCKRVLKGGEGRNLKKRDEALGSGKYLWLIVGRKAGGEKTDMCSRTEEKGGGKESMRVLKIMEKKRKC